MSKSVFVLAVSAVASMSSLADGPIDGTIYGKVNISVVKIDNSIEKKWELQSNASRLGFKGKSQLAEGLYAIYKLEYEVDMDGDNDGDVFKQRNIIAGLSGSLGTIWAGRHDTPTKLAQNKIDLFNDLPGDMNFAFEGENRVSNIVSYVSPSFHGASFMLSSVFAEGDDFDQNGYPDDSVGDAVSASLSYESDKLYLTLAVDQDLDQQSLVRAVGQWNFDNLQLGLMYQQNESNLDSSLLDESGYFTSTAYSMNAVVLKAQYGYVEDEADNDEYKTWSIGADYKLAKGSKLFVFYTDNTDNDGLAKAEREVKYIGVGLEHNF